MGLVQYYTYNWYVKGHNLIIPLWWVMLVHIPLFWTTLHWSIPTWWPIPRIVSGLVHPSYKWINPTYPIYNWGYNPLTKWDGPPSTKPGILCARGKREMCGSALAAGDHRKTLRKSAICSGWLMIGSPFNIWYVSPLIFPIQNGRPWAPYKSDSMFFFLPSGHSIL